jgi:hypothetical protein
MGRLAGAGVQVDDGTKGQAFTLDAAALTSIGNHTSTEDDSPQGPATDKEERFAVDSHADK